MAGWGIPNSYTDGLYSVASTCADLDSVTPPPSDGRMRSTSQPIYPLPSVPRDVDTSQRFFELAATPMLEHIGIPLASLTGCFTQTHNE